MTGPIGTKFGIWLVFGICLPVIIINDCWEYIIEVEVIHQGMS